MQVQVEIINSVKRKVSIEVPAEQVNVEIEKSFADIQKKVTLAGFRKGKAPLKMIKKMYHDAMQDDVKRKLYEKTLFPVLDEHKIEPVDAPLIDDDILVAPDTSFSYSALVEVVPQIKLNDYKGLNVKKERQKSGSDAVEGEINRMRENMAQLVPVEEGAVEKGMVLTVDFKMTVADASEEDSEGQDATIEVGGGNLLPGLEDGLLGMSIGETKQITVTMPEGNENKKLAGAQAIFTITVKGLKKKELPELDDAFAQSFGEFESMEDLRSKLSEMHLEQDSNRIEADLKVRIVDALIEKNQIEVPDSFVNRQLDFMLDNFKERLKKQKMTIERLGLDADAFRERFKEEAIQKVKGGLLVMALIDEEKIGIEESDLEARYDLIANGNEALKQNIRQFYTDQPKVLNSLIAEIKEDKAIKFLIDHAVITEVDAEELTSEAEKQ